MRQVSLARGGQLIVLLALAAAFAAVRAEGVEPERPSSSPSSWIAIFPSGVEPALRNHGVAIWSRDPDFVLGGASSPALQELAEEGIVPSLKILDHGQWMYVFGHPKDVVAPFISDASAYRLSPTADLYLFSAGLRVELPRIAPPSGFLAVPRKSLAPVVPHPADSASSSVRADAVTNPLVSQIVSATNQSGWFQFVKDLSGENPVTIGEATYTISTRFSDAMFPPADNARASEYILDRAAGWGYAGVRETFTSADSGCGSQTLPWQNLVFTLPGQVDFGRHQQVLFITHYDSLSFSRAEGFLYAPGADDALSGGSALLEALRIFKDYAFRNTVKVVFFSGEEQGMCGSTAYTRQHPASDFWRVVNMDQTAYDGDQNLLMNVYNWDATNSPASVALGDFFVQANADYGSIIAPEHILRDASKMCATDHCPFWNVGAAAITVIEDLHDYDLCPCFDAHQTPTCHDTVTQIYNGRLMFGQDYSWPSEKAAIAAVAALAEPLYTCPASAPTPTIVSGSGVLRLTWPTVGGVTNYVVERASSCSDLFTSVASITGTNYEDDGLTNGTSYAYRIRTCPNEVGACVSGTPKPGPSVVYATGSARVVADSGDHDAIPDNCELVTVGLDLVNDGNAPLTGVRLAAVFSSHPAVRIATAVPQIVGPLAIGASAPVSFKFYLGRDGVPAVCGDPLPFLVTAASGESPPRTRSFTLTAEQASAGGPLVYGFDTDLSGWTVTSGSFTRETGGAPGSTAFSLHSRNQDDDCDAVISPTIVPADHAIVTMAVNYDIEPGAFDRAVVRAIDTRTGVKTLLTPTGTPYTTTGNIRLLCDNVGNLQGWSGNASSWNPASFDLSAFAYVPTQLEVRYSTNASTLGVQGFWFDDVRIDGADQIECDVRPNTCGLLPSEVSPAGSATPLILGRPSKATILLRFSESAGALKYNVYTGTLPSLRQGVYDHAAAPGLCGFTDATPGDGIVVVSVAASTIPASSYLLVAAENEEGESIYGTDSRGAPTPLALSNCP
jgi:hypothetical protein